MEIRDPVHGSIQISTEETPIVGHRFFQRLRNIKQLGFLEYAFPGATHTRFLHSVGVMEIATRAFDRLFSDHQTEIELKRLRQTLRLAGLLHDIGHAPLSHSTETVMPEVGKLYLPERFLTDSKPRQATHEDYTVKSIVDSGLTESFGAVESKFGVDRNAVAELILGTTQNKEYFTYKGVNLFPLLHQLISSEMDCDRMDYLLRDSYFCGVSYGSYDLDWIIDNLATCTIEGNSYLGISERALTTLDDFLLSRFHMFVMVYFHYRSVCMEQMLYRYFKTAPNEYSIPGNIEQYQKHDDHYLMEILRDSSNPWAQKIINNDIPPKVFEAFGGSQQEKLQRLDFYLKNNNVDHLRCSSQGRLSKYSSEQGTFPMQMVRKFHSSDREDYFDIFDSTDLFEKFSHAHSVDRIHCDLPSLSQEVREEILKIMHS